jgi:hypothetical protein
MNAVDFATYLAIALPLGGFLTWILRHYLSELRPNGGSSIKDKVDALDDKVTRLESRIDEIYGILIKK